MYMYYCCITFYCFNVISLSLGLFRHSPSPPLLLLPLSPPHSLLPYHPLLLLTNSLILVFNDLHLCSCCSCSTFRLVHHITGDHCHKTNYAHPPLGLGELIPGRHIHLPTQSPPKSHDTTIYGSSSTGTMSGCVGSG